jgi:hypothetical protein
MPQWAVPRPFVAAVTPFEISMHHRSFYRRLVFTLCIASLFGPHCIAAEPTLKSGIDKANFDLSVKPGDDFFEHVNGEWIKHNPIPPEYSRWGAFPKLRDDNLIALHEILDELVSTKEELSDERPSSATFIKPRWMKRLLKSLAYRHSNRG